MKSLEFYKTKSEELERQLNAQGSLSYAEIQKTCGNLSRKNEELKEEIKKLRKTIDLLTKKDTI